jgi:hypothetical protein
MKQEKCGLIICVSRQGRKARTLSRAGSTRGPGGRCPPMMQILDMMPRINGNT